MPRTARRVVTVGASLVVLPALALAPGVGSPAAASVTVATTSRAVPSHAPGRTVAPTSRATPSDPLVPARYLSQVVTWTPCFTRSELVEDELPLSFLRLQCATYQVPLDWDDPDAGTDVSIAISRLPATRPARGSSGHSIAPVVFTNPGGPGGPGRTLPLVFLMAGRTSLLAAQDVYGIDVRGTGDSTSVTCGGWSQVSVDYRDPSGPAATLLLDLAQAHARSCQLFGGALGAHVTTAQTVRDLDLLRRLAGRETVNWIGYSAGTWLGARYATAYPRHVGRFVFDSNTDFTSDWQTVFSWQPMAFQRRFREDFTPWVAANRRYFGMGATAGAVEAYYEQLRADLAAAALADPSSVPLDGPSLDAMIAGGLYSKHDFQSLAEILVLIRRILDGELPEGVARGRTATPAAVAAARAARRALARVQPRLDAALAAARDGRAVLDPAPSGSAGSAGPAGMDSFDSTFYTITCTDTPWTGDRTSLTDDARTSGTSYPLLGWSTIDQPCVFWDRSAAPASPNVTGRGVPSVLMVQSAHDPATALEGAQNAASHFAGARLLTVTGEGDHGIYASENACVDTAVERFLLTGVLPAPSATCAGIGLPPLLASEASLDAAGLAASPALAGATRTSAGRARASASGRRTSAAIAARPAVPLVSQHVVRDPLGRAAQVAAAVASGR